MMRRHHLVILVFLFTLWMGLGPALAVEVPAPLGWGGGRTLETETVLLYPAADTYILNTSSSWQPGTDTTLHCKEYSYDTKRTLMRFDLTGLPQNAVIEQATLELFVTYSRASSGAPQLSLHHLLKPWDEAKASWTSTGAVGDWAAPGMAAGGDYEATPFATASLTTLNAYNTVDLTAAARRWWQNPGANYGFVALVASFQEARWWSRERQSDRPRLRVTYRLDANWTPLPTATVTATPTPTQGGPTATPGMATATPTARPQVTATVTPTPTFPPSYTTIRSTGIADALGAGTPGDCITAYPDQPASTEVLLVWQGVPVSAKLTFLYTSNNNRRHSVMVNGQVIGELPGDNYRTKCAGPGLASLAEIPFDPALVRSGINTITILADKPGEIDGWSIQSPQIHLSGALQGSTIQVVQLTSSYDGTTQRAMIQKPAGYLPGAPTPLVIGLHGWGARDYDALKWLAKAANDRGWLLACSDTRNDNQHTASKAVQRDVMDLINYLVNNTAEYTVDTSRIYIVGSSMGGMMAATIAAKYPDRFAALVELKGPTLLDQWYWETESWRQAVLAAEVGGTPTNNPFGYQRCSAAAMPMNLRHVPTVIIHGRNDQTVPFHHAEDLYNSMLAFAPRFVALYPYDGGHNDDHPDWDAEAIMDFFSQHVLDPNPLQINIRTDEPKWYYWLGVSYVAADHWTQASASYDPLTRSITLEVRDERATPLSVNITISLARLGLPGNIAYTVEDSNLDTGEYSQYEVQAGATELVLTVPRDRRRLVVYPHPGQPLQTVTLRQGEGGYAGVEDTYIESYNITANHGAEDKMVVSNGGSRTPLLRFDLGTALPSGVVVKAAQLKLVTTYKWGSSDSLETSIYRLRRPWSAAQATWLKANGEQNWSAAGALGAEEDYDPVPVTSRVLRNYDTYSYNVTDLVRQWLADPASNYGLLLRGGGGGSCSFQLGSSEAPSANNRPMLVVIYTDPTPTFTPTHTATPTATPTATATSTPSPTPTARGRAYLPLIRK